MAVLPITNIEYGTNYACFIDDKAYICSCQKKSLENRILLYKTYFTKYSYYDILTGITYDKADTDLLKFVLGLPECLNKQIDFLKDIIPQIDFKNFICHDCNGVDADFKIILHKGSKMYRNEPYKINKVISLGIYPTGDFPPKMMKYYFILPNSAPLTYLKNLSPSSEYLDNMHSENKNDNISLIAIKEFEKTHSASDSKNILLLPFSLGIKVEYKYSFDFLTRLRKRTKTTINNLILNILKYGYDGLQIFESNYLKYINSHSHYNYVIEDGKIIMDTCLKRYIETEIKIMSQYIEDFSVLHFCKLLHLPSVFYRPIKDIDTTEIINNITFRHNLLFSEDKVEKKSNVYYFALLSAEMKITLYNGLITLIGINNNNSCVFFNMIEEFQLHSYVSTMINNFMKKTLSLSYYKIKDKYFDLIIKLLAFILPCSTKNDNVNVEEIFKEVFVNELSEAKIDLSSEYMWDVLWCKSHLLRRVQTLISEIY